MRKGRKRKPITYWWHIADVALAVIGLVGNIYLQKLEREKNDRGNKT